MMRLRKSQMPMRMGRRLRTLQRGTGSVRQ